MLLDIYNHVMTWSAKRLIVLLKTLKMKKKKREKIIQTENDNIGIMRFQVSAAPIIFLKELLT